MGPFLIVSFEEVRKTLYRLPDGGVVFEIQLFVLDGPPEPFNEDIESRSRKTGQ